MIKFLLKVLPTSLLEEEISKRFIGDINATELKDFQIETVLSDMSKVPNIEDFLKSTMKADKNRFFNASDDKSRDMVRGAYSRTLWLLKSIVKMNKNQSEIASTELTLKGDRTATIV
jgi:hypothetical protein